MSVADEAEKTPWTYGRHAEYNLDRAGVACENGQHEKGVALALRGIGFAILSQSESQEQFHSVFTEFARMFRGGDGKAMIDVWVTK
jgi:hypothetical protein